MKNSISKHSLFLIEMMIAILFFALCAAVCLSMFVSAHQISIGSQDLTRALNVAQQAAECLKEDQENITVILGGKEIEDDIYAIYYDEEWNVITNEDQAVYQTRIEIKSHDPLLVADIKVYKGETDIYQVEVKKYHG